MQKWVKCLNLGCGNHFHNAWTNIDIASQDPNVIIHDLIEPLPFEADTFDVVYHSSVLEHFTKSEAMRFMRECMRVLKRGSLLRVAVPNLEGITRAYLKALDEALCDYPQAALAHEWMLLELYDQATREYAGGEMAEYFRDKSTSELTFALQRIGSEGLSLLRNMKKATDRDAQWTNQFKFSLRRFVRKPIEMFILFPKILREYAIKCLLSKMEYNEFKISRFRSSGEAHRWMYDRYSLRLLMQKTGFINVAQRDANTSYHPNWADFNLDTEPDGSVRKPDSLYMEGIKPG